MRRRHPDHRAPAAAAPAPASAQNGMRLRGALPMSRPRVTPQPGCENDIRGRFTAEPGWDSQGDASVSDCAEVTCALASRRAVAGWDARAGTGATPPTDAPVVAWARVCFTPTAPARSLPSMDPYGKAGRPMPEASGNIIGLGTVERFRTRRPRSGSSRQREPRVVICPTCARSAYSDDVVR